MANQLHQSPRQNAGGIDDAIEPAHRLRRPVDGRDVIDAGSDTSQAIATAPISSATALAALSDAVRATPSRQPSGPCHGVSERAHAWSAPVKRAMPSSVRGHVPAPPYEGTPGDMHRF
jgi:hypothetical protein